MKCRVIKSAWWLANTLIAACKWLVNWPEIFCKIKQTSSVLIYWNTQALTTAFFIVKEAEVDIRGTASLNSRNHILAHWIKELSNLINSSVGLQQSTILVIEYCIDYFGKNRVIGSKMQCADCDFFHVVCTSMLC